MTRPAGGWIPDGRAKAILADCEASLAALDGLEIDLYLIHAPDPRTPWRTSVRALARLVDEGLVRRVGVSNVNRDQLDEALALAPISAVQVALSVLDDRALRGGVVERCVESGVAVIAHSPLGGPRGVRTLGRRPALTDVAAAHDVSPHEVALAWLLDLSPAVIAIPGARRPETARSAAAAATLRLGDEERTALTRAFGGLRPAPAEPRAASGDARGGRRHGHPGRREEPHRRGPRRPRLRPPEPRRARGVPPRARGRARGRARVGRPACRARQHLPDARNAKPRHRRRAPARAPGAVHLAGHAARPGPGQPRRAGARPRRLAPEPRGAPRPRAARRRRAHADVADARAPRARATVGRRGVDGAGAGAVRAGAAVPGRRDRRVRRGRGPGHAGLEGRARRGGPERAASAVRLAARRRCRRARPRGRRARGGGLRPGGGRAVRAPRRAAELLVPTAAARAADGVRASARHRAVALRRSSASAPPTARSPRPSVPGSSASECQPSGCRATKAMPFQPPRCSHSTRS